MLNKLDKIATYFIGFFIIIFTAFLLVITVPYNQSLVMDKQFLPFFYNFKKDAEKYGVSLPITNIITIFVPKLPENELAYCIPSLRTVKVSKEEWDKQDTISKKILLYHEWGHCVLDREHVFHTFVVANKCPTSIMYPYIDPIPSCYLKNPSWYEEELFTNI